MGATNAAAVAIAACVDVAVAVAVAVSANRLTSFLPVTLNRSSSCRWQKSECWNTGGYRGWTVTDVNRPQCIRVCEIDIHQQLILCASATMYGASRERESAVFRGGDCVANWLVKPRLCSPRWHCCGCCQSCGGPTSTWPT